MDPLVALGVAGNIVAFVQFAGSILNGARKLHGSTSGASDQTDSLEALFGTLSGFASRLKVEQSSRTAQGDLDANSAVRSPTSSDHASQLRSLASKCDTDCGRLLALLKRLNVKTRSGPGWWKSFQVAFLELLKSAEVMELRQRINEYQTSIIAIFCALSNESVGMLSGEIQGLASALQASESRMSEQLCSISSRFTDSSKKIALLQKRHGEGATAVESVGLALGDIDKHLGDVHKLVADVRGLLEQGRTLSKQLEVLLGLHYDERPMRYESISVAHQETFQWVFQDVDATACEPGDLTALQSGQDRLVTWLREGNGSFWISGKPGSGKSTFMKFLVGHADTASALQTWAGDKTVIIASHYFWAAGSALQKSDEGLLRSLLFNVLDQCPELIPKVLHQRWTQAGAKRESHWSKSSSPWTRSELQTAIDMLKMQLDLPVQFCFFIDGLDEFSGDHHGLSRLIKGLSETSGIKVCVSSRPWNVFEEYFGSSLPTKIYIHELTLRDIRLYAASELSRESRWLTSELEKDKSWIIDQITERAQGVFLWVYLVARQLRDGLTNHDTALDLRKRLDEIPTDLEEFFKKIITSVEPFYREKMAWTLKLALAAEEALPTTIYAFHDLEYDEEEYFMDSPHELWSREKFTEFDEPLGRRINARCKGLLEIHGQHVQFLHRTVRDFLRTAEMKSLIESQQGKRSFSPNLSIFQAYASWAARTHGGLKILDPSPTLLSAFRYVGHAFDDSDASTDSICDRIDRLESLVVTPYLVSDGVELLLRMGFRKQVVKTELAMYLSRKLPMDPQYFPKLYFERYGPPLESVLNVESPWTPKSVRLLQCLLHNGHNPNEKSKTSHSLWAVYLQGILAMSENRRNRWNTTVFLTAFTQGALPMLLDFGADPNPPDSKECSSEPWEGLLTLVMDVKHAELAEHANSVTRIFDTMLSAAHFDAQCSCRGPDELKSKRCRELHNLRHPRVKDRRILAWRYICNTLQDSHLRAEIEGVGHRKHQYLHLLAEVLVVFITKARHPMLQEQEILPHLDMFPLDARNRIANAIRISSRPFEVGEIAVISPVGAPPTPSAIPLRPIFVPPTQSLSATSPIFIPQTVSPSVPRPTSIPPNQLLSTHSGGQVQYLQDVHMPAPPFRGPLIPGTILGTGQQAAHPWQQPFDSWQQPLLQWQQSAPFFPSWGFRGNGGGLVGSYALPSPSLSAVVPHNNVHQQGWPNALANALQGGYGPGSGTGYGHGNGRGYSTDGGGGSFDTLHLHPSSQQPPQWYVTSDGHAFWWPGNTPYPSQGWNSQQYGNWQGDRGHGYGDQ